MICLIKSCNFDSFSTNSFKHGLLIQSRAVGRRLIGHLWDKFSKRVRRGSVSACEGCCNRVPQAGGSHDRNVLFHSLGLSVCMQVSAQSVPSQVRAVKGLLQAPLLASRRPSLCSRDVLPVARLCVQISSSYDAVMRISLGLPLTTSV